MAWRAAAGDAQSQIPARPTHRFGSNWRPQTACRVASGSKVANSASGGTRKALPKVCFMIVSMELSLPWSTHDLPHPTGPHVISAHGVGLEGDLLNIVRRISMTSSKAVHAGR